MPQAHRRLSSQGVAHHIMLATKAPHPIEEAGQLLPPVRSSFRLAPSSAFAPPPAAPSVVGGPPLLRAQPLFQH